MQQIKQVAAGERDYSKIEGQTGPLVYPAGHVLIYRILYSATQQGANILTAQLIFGVLYIFNLAIVMACYRAAKVNTALGRDHCESRTNNPPGTGIHLPNVDLVEKTAQHLPAPLFQRLLRHRSIVFVHLLLSEKRLDPGHNCLHCWSLRQNEPSLGFPSRGHHPVPSYWPQ